MMTNMQWRSYAKWLQMKNNKKRKAEPVEPPEPPIIEEGLNFVTKDGYRFVTFDNIPFKVKG